jgi:hypothetical protein
MRAARITCTVGGLFSVSSDRVSFTAAPSRTGATSSSSTRTFSSMKNGLPSVYFGDQLLDGG